MNRRTFITRSTIAGVTLGSFAKSAFPQSRNPTFRLGIDTLVEENFRSLRGKRVGLLTHPAGVDRFGRSTVGLLEKTRQVQLVALFGPEHGIYGDEKANIPVEDKIDPKTRLPVFSLYGKYRRPTEKMLKGLDALVVDLQDLGTRSYTYISCLKYVLEACFEAEVEVVVLDRPNPLGGLKIDGPGLDSQWTSYVGAWPVPYVYGMTIGELANWGKQVPGILAVDPSSLKKGRLRIIPMQGWSRHMLWTETGLDWVPTSPAIPSLSAAMGYPMTGLGTQLGGFRHGYGTQYPFRLLQFSGKSPEEIKAVLQSRRIRGMDYQVIQLEEKGKPRRGTFVIVSDWNALRPTELSFEMMKIACDWSGQNPFQSASAAQQGLFNKHVGDGAWLSALQKFGGQADLSAFLNKWANQHRLFKRSIQPYLLYS